MIVRVLLAELFERIAILFRKVLFESVKVLFESVEELVNVRVQVHMCVETFAKGLSNGGASIGYNSSESASGMHLNSSGSFSGMHLNTMLVKQYVMYIFS